MINSPNRDTEKCLIVPVKQKNSTKPFVLTAEGKFEDYAAYISATPFSDNDLVAPIPCLDGTRILNSFGVGFGRGEIVIEIFCGESGDKQGGYQAQSVFDSVRIANSETGIAVTGKGANFLFFPDTLTIGGFDPARGTVQARIGGFAYTQEGSS